MIEVLLRTFHKDEHVTLSDLLVANFKCKVLELPWRNNEPRVSCIPPGKYDVIWSLSPRFHVFMYEIVRVPMRGGIRIHSGNTVDHTLGCPLVGQQILSIKGRPFISISKPTLVNFENHLERKPFKLIVVRP